MSGSRVHLPGPVERRVVSERRTASPDRWTAGTPGEATPRSMFDAAAARQSQGDLVGAEDLYSELAAELAETLGPAHADTQRTEYHWAVLCEQLGDYDAAGELYRRVDAGQAAAGMAEDDPDRLRTKMGLVNVLVSALFV